jgi:dynein heavy chain, axonemal
MEAAKNAVKGLSVKSIGEMKGFGTPPAGVPDVGKCVFILKGEYSAKKQEWPMVQNMMKDPAKFMTMLETYNKEAIPDKALELLKPIMAQDFFNEETMMKKSSAAANICKWVIAVVTYNGIYRNTKPLMDAAAEAEGIATEKGRELDEVMAKLQIVRDRVAALNSKLSTAKASLKEVMDKQDALMAQLGLAQRLVDGLADEQIRWT